MCGWNRAITRSTASRKLVSRWNRSATWVAWGAPAVAAFAYAAQRSRVITWTPGWAFSHASTAVPSRPGSRSITRPRSRSMRTVPYTRPFRRAKSSMPTNRYAGSGPSGAVVTRRSRVSPLVGTCNSSATREPGSPPRANPRTRCRSASRAVVWAWASATPVSRSQNRRRGQPGWVQRNLRAVTTSATRRDPMATSASVRR